MATRAVVAIAFAAAAGCGGSVTGLTHVDAGSSDAASPGDAPALDAGDPPADVAPVDATEADVGAPPFPVSFVLTNATGRPIYIQTSGFSTQGYWSLGQAGRRLPVDNTCEICDCGACPSCAVCGRALARVTEIAPGAQHQWTWDGRIWEPVPDGCRASLACEQDQIVPAGAALAVAVTYSFSFAVDTTSGADDQFIGTPLTATAALAHGPGAAVSITVTE
jgi:hypothetical protein